MLKSASLVPPELLFLKAGSWAVRMLNEARLYQAAGISNLLVFGLGTQPGVAASLSCVSNLKYL